MNKIKVYLLPGKHAQRTPFAYPDYRPFFIPYFDFVTEPLAADFIVASYFVDLRSEAAQLLAWQKARPALKLVVFSEEPLWDSLWYEDFIKPTGQFSVKINGVNHTLKYDFLNHATTDIFNFVQLPYFITTENHYIQRYAKLLAGNLQLTAQQLLTLWQNVRYRHAFMAEKRTEAKYHKVNQSGELLGLSVYRSELAAQFLSHRTASVQGRGWHSDTARQALPDWHLDKLTSLHGNVMLMSAIENTVLGNYITEKPFDAFAINAIPITYAGPDSRLYDVINKNEDAVVNIFGMSVDEATQALRELEPTVDSAERYQAAQQAVLQKVQSFPLLIAERERVAFSSFFAFERLLSLE
ncbi:hypothetical protein [Rheinheimera maricola]|uniref:Glycosyltransferase family 1 protein n=1 Tax=Rheinheimera maricola TaxID=2793282 RepID=A0ABS7X5F6_9GAMM|nr:hypothetical protein [Rheinheimera maricola]MBZ9610350.1 hypothetical protein [Rheinheimera maricola]